MVVANETSVGKVAADECYPLKLSDDVKDKIIAAVEDGIYAAKNDHKNKLSARQLANEALRLVGQTIEEAGQKLRTVGRTLQIASQTTEGGLVDINLNDEFVKKLRESIENALGANEAAKVAAEAVKKHDEKPKYYYGIVQTFGPPDPKPYRPSGRSSSGRSYYSSSDNHRSRIVAIPSVF